MNRVLRFVLAAVLACSALMLTACQGSPSGSNDKKTYKIGVLRIDDSLPLYTAETEKLFAKHGVDVQVIEFSSAADQQKAMEAGELDGMMTDMIVTALLKKSRYRRPRRRHGSRCRPPGRPVPRRIVAEQQHYDAAAADRCLRRHFRKYHDGLFDEPV